MKNTVTGAKNEQRQTLWLSSDHENGLIIAVVLIFLFSFANIKQSDDNLFPFNIFYSACDFTVT